MTLEIGTAEDVSVNHKAQMHTICACDKMTKEDKLKCFQTKSLMSKTVSTFDNILPPIFK